MTDRFTINSTHQSFNQKQNDLFASLENAEKSASKLPQNSQMDVDNEPDKPPAIKPTNEERRRDRNECTSRNNHNNFYNKNPHMKQYKSRESIFKRPEAPLARCLPHGKIPGFRKNPNNWTKYTLEDVKDEDMSDRSNTQAAFSFLKSIERSKGVETEEKVEKLPEKIVFKKSSIIKKKQQEEVKNVQEDEEKCTFKSSKVVMPEYVVGQSGKKDKKKKVQISSKSDGEKSKIQLKLDHLNDDDEDDM